MEKHLHIVSLNVPYPPDHGGMVDLFYKLPALQQQGVKIHLHCFIKDRAAQPELNNYCEEVFYYERNTTAKNLLSKFPYIVFSRKNEALTNRLLQDDYPVFMEGVHCTYITNDARFKKRKMFVRIHNAENKYYGSLFKFSDSIRNKIYYLVEAQKLKQYEKNLAKNATAYWAVTKQDTDYYKQELDCKTMDYLPLFIPQWQVGIKEGIGSYCLYHGNLGIEENEYAAAWLLKNVFDELEIPLIIAGKNPSKKLVALSAKNTYSCVVPNPDETQMQDIISKAHIHVLPSFNNTGIKIKLLNALFNGRHCLVNNAMIAGTALKELCHIANKPDEFIEMIMMLYHQPFTEQEKDFRKNILEKEFSNEANARQIVHWIWTQYA